MILISLWSFNCWSPSKVNLPGDDMYTIAQFSSQNSRPRYSTNNQIFQSLSPFLIVLILSSYSFFAQWAMWITCKNSSVCLFVRLFISAEHNISFIPWARVLARSGNLLSNRRTQRPVYVRNKKLSLSCFLINWIPHKELASKVIYRLARVL